MGAQCRVVEIRFVEKGEKTSAGGKDCESETKKQQEI